MKFGIQHGMGDPRWQREIIQPQAVSEFSRRVEALGYSYVAFTDHPAPSGRWVDSGGEGVADPFTALAFCAAVTESIGLLTFVLVPAFHNPAALAQRVATLDALSGGRLALGLGTGYLKAEFFAVGADFESRRDAFDRGVDVLRGAFAGGDVNAEGPGYSARAIRVQPPVTQLPHPPLWIHGNGRFGTERAADYGQGWIGLLTNEQSVRTIRTTPMHDLDAFARGVARFRELCERRDRSPDEAEIVATAILPILDPREGWDTEQRRDIIGQLEQIGVTTLIVNAVGDDVGASIEGAQRFAAEFIG